MKSLNTAARLRELDRGRWWAVAGLAVVYLALANLGCGREAPRGVTKFVSPQYPAVARIYHLTGSVNLIVQIGANGRAISAKGSGSIPVLVEAAERNVMEWEFELPKAGPFPVVRTIVYDFRLIGRPSMVGFTTTEVIRPDRVRVEDQPASEKVPEGIPPGGIEDCFSENCRLR